MCKPEEKGSGRRIEQEAVRTTIVGGRPPGSGKPVGDVPRGIEVLIKKAVVDPQFRQLLLEKRAEAAKSIGLVLRPSEIAMLNGIPREQLEAIISQTHVDSKLRPVLMGTAAAVMLVALGAELVGCPFSLGCRPAGVHPQPPPAANSPATKNPDVAPPPVSADTDAVQKTAPVDVRPSQPQPVPPQPIAPGGARPDRP